jgi:hypothetical protein
METIALKLLEPLIVTIVGALTSWALVWLRKFIQAKTGIIVADDKFQEYVAAVKQVEEESLSEIFLGKGPAKEARANEIAKLSPKLKNESLVEIAAGIKKAVAVEPSVGATAKASCADSQGTLLTDGKGNYLTDGQGNIFVSSPTPEYVPKCVTP